MSPETRRAKIARIDATIADLQAIRAELEVAPEEERAQRRVASEESPSLLTADDVVKRLRLSSRSALRGRMNRGTAPQPDITYPGGDHRWEPATIDNWLAGLKNDKGGARRHLSAHPEP